MKKPFLISLVIFTMLMSVIPAAGAETTPVPAPKSLKAEIMTSYILVSTSEATPAGQYTTIEKSVDSGDFYMLTSLSTGSDSFRDYGVTNGHTYKYRAKRCISSSSKSSVYSNESEVLYIFPLSLNINNTYSDQINLSWTYPDTAAVPQSDYQTIVERREENESSWKTIYTAPFLEQVYQDYDLKPDTNYYYRIRTKYSNDNYSYYIPSSEGINRRTLISLTTPITGYALDDARIRLEWDSSALNGTTAQIQKMGVDGEFDDLWDSDTDDHYIDADLDAGNEYYYRLYQISDHGSVSGYSETLCIRTETLPSPLNIKVSPISLGRMAISWDYPYDLESGFEIWRKEEGSIWQRLDTPSRNITSLTDYTALMNKTYTYKVRAIRGDNVFSDFIASSPVNNADPGAPPPLVIFPVEYGLLIGTDNAPPQGLKYTLEYRTGINENWADHTSNKPGTPLLAQFILLHGKEIDIRLRSENQGNISYGPIKHIYSTKPEAPSGLSAAITGYGRVVLSWMDNTDKEDGFKIYRTSGGIRTLIGTAGRDERIFADTKVVPGAAVKYEVCASNLRGESDFAKLNVVIPRKTVFGDVTNILWGVDAVNTLCSMGAISGNSEGLFYPDRTITTAEFTTILMKAFNIIPQPGYLFSVKDLPANAWYYPYMMTAVKLGIVIPDESGKAYPLSPVTKANVAILLDRVAACRNQPLKAYDVSTLDKFSDGYLVQDELKDIVASLAGDNIMPAQTGKPLSLGAPATRIEAAAIIYKFYLKYSAGR